jgi:putative membrane protein
MMDNYNGYGQMMDGNHWGWMLIVLLLVILAVVITMVVLRHLHAQHGYGSTNEVTALELLKRRYVKGDLSKDEYRSMKNDIE